VIECKIKRGLVAAAGHTLKFTSSSVEFTLYIYIPQSTSRFFIKKNTREKATVLHLAFFTLEIFFDGSWQWQW
jgi:hypothetical protein